MKRMRVLWIRLLGLLHVRRPSELDAELESHLQLHIDDNLRAGMNTQEARRVALIKLGGLAQTRQQYRERSTLPFLESLFHDMRYGLRMMARNRSFTAIAVLTLAIGIGTTTTVFSWIDSVLLRPLSGVSEPARLFTLETVTANGEMVPNSYPDYQDFRDHLHLLSGIAVTRPAAFSLGQQDHAERVWGELVSGNFFAVLGVRAEAGRVFLPEEYGDKPGAFPVVVISDRYWRTHFNAAPSAVGRVLRINQHDLTIVGVAPPEFHGAMPATAFDLWIPYMQQPVLNGVPSWLLRNRQNRNMLGVARLADGATMTQALQELSALSARMAIANADSDAGMSATLLPLAKSPHGPQAMLAAPLTILMCVSMLVLLIVCANVANLLLARAASREKEFSTRIALGAGRMRLVRQAFTESLMLAFAGSALGVALTFWMSHLLGYLLPPGQMALSLHADWSGHLLLFTAALCAFTALTAGLAPALHLRGMNLHERMSAGGRSGTSSASTQRLRSSVLIAEIALAFIALVGAGLFARGFAATRQMHPGFDADHVLLSQFYLSTSGYSLDQRKAFCRRLADKLQTTPGVTMTAYSDGVPLGFEPSWWEELDVQGYTPATGENMKILRNVISPGYLPLMHIPLLDGRNFTEHDDEKANGVMIVNQEFVRRYYAGRSPIGHRIHGWGDWFTVVGVAADSKYHYLGESPMPYAYFAFRQVYRADMQLAFYTRAQQEPEAMIAGVRQSVREIDENVAAMDSMPLREFIGAALYPQRVAATLLALMGGLAVLLAAVGIYSVMAYSVVQRTREIGIRMALGATPRHVLGQVVRQGLALCAIALPVGLGLSLILARSVAAVSFSDSAMGGGTKLLPGSVFDPAVYVGAMVFLGSVAVLAALIPARRAAGIQPVIALRAE